MSGSKRPFQSTLEFVPVDETGERVVCRTVRHLETQTVLFGDVAKYQHSP
jgi:hypothetical protein